MDLSKNRDDPHGVQALLAVLRAQDNGQRASAAPAVSAHPPSSGSSPIPPAQASSDATSPAVEDLRYISFSQALSHLHRLSQDLDFLDAILAEKSKQDYTERQIAKDREAFAASLGVSKDAVDDEALARFDRQALVRWDAVLSAQQRRFEELGVPCFFVTRDAAQLTKQERIFGTLSSLLDG